MSSSHEPPSEAVQDYLKIIYDLTAGRPAARASTTQIANRLDVRPASVTGMLRKLASEKLVDYRKHQGVRLTDQGLAQALRVIRHHRLIETYLVERLGYSWDEVHEEAERLEHAISPAVSQRMADLLGNPRRDPHGDPIPTRQLDMPPRVTTRLCDLHPGEMGRIASLTDHEPRLLRRAADLGLHPHTSLTLLERPAAPGDSLLAAVGERVVAIPAELADHIFIKREKS